MNSMNESLRGHIRLFPLIDDSRTLGLRDGRCLAVGSCGGRSRALRITDAPAIAEYTAGGKLLHGPLVQFFVTPGGQLRLVEH